MAPFEALYGRKCRTPLAWSEVGERTLFGPAIIEEAEEKVEKVRENLKIAQSHQKSYADKRRRELTFAVGDRVYLKVSPLRGTKRFLVKGKLAPRYVGPYPITRRIGSLAYQLALPETMAGVHPVFHVSQLKKSEKAVEAKQVPMELLDLQDNLEYTEYPEKSWTEQSRRQGEQLFISVECCGATIPSEKQHGRRKLISGKSTLTCSQRRSRTKSRGRDSRWWGRM
jgi:hypothetical protein